MKMRRRRHERRSGNSYNIDIWGLLIALGMVAVAAIISELMHMGIGKTLMWSSCRALVQLCAMGSSSAT